jgi:hypothetical protein
MNGSAVEECIVNAVARIRSYLDPEAYDLLASLETFALESSRLTASILEMIPPESVPDVDLD